VLAVDTDVIVVISALWQTTCTLVRSGEEGFVIDSPLLPDELEALPSLAQQAGFPVSGLLATHGDWDHLLGRLAFPEASLGVAQSTLDRLNSEPGAAQRRLRQFDDEWYVERPGPLQLGSLQALPVPGRLSIGADGHEIELHPTPGHTPDGCAYWLSWCGVLIAGDYLSPTELPSGSDQEAYVATLERLQPLVEQAATVIPGHGAPMASTAALQVLSDDLASLRASSSGGLSGAPVKRPKTA
jgi:glyoxylase-like metal-dependent hydrolase (beta-lactamase superfamily II)